MALLMDTDAYAAWLDGDLTDDQALHALINELGEVQDDLGRFKAEETRLRAHISHIVAKIGKPVTLPGYGELRITDPYKTATFDRKALDALVMQLRDAGHGDVADLILACRHESATAGSLRITREKQHHDAR